MFGMRSQSSKNPHELEWAMMGIYCIFTVAFYRVLWYSILISPQSLVLEYVLGHNRLIFVAPNIKNGFPCSYKCFLHASDVPCLLDWFFSFTLGSLSLSFSSRPLRATLPHLSSSQLLDPWWCFSSLGQEDFLSFPLPLDSTTLHLFPCPDHPTAWIPTAGQIFNFQRFSFSAGEFSSGWQIIQKYFKTRVREEVWEEFSLKIPETPRKSQHVGYINSWKNTQMYRWFHKASFTYLRGKKAWILWNTYSNQFEIFTDHFACTVTSAWQKTTPHIYYYETCSEANLL